MSMKISKQIIISGLFIAAICASCIFSVARAENGDISDRQIQLIKDNCLSVKNTLTQLHSSDALLRVNMGQSYESISTKLMVRFNNRLANNNITNVNLVNVTNSFAMVLDTFRFDYISYEEQLTIAINIDCQKQPVTFYDAVAAARTKRQLIHADIQRLNQQLDQYKSEFVTFQNDYKTAAEGIKLQ